MKGSRPGKMITERDFLSVGIPRGNKDGTDCIAAGFEWSFAMSTSTAHQHRMHCSSKKRPPTVYMYSVI